MIIKDGVGIRNWKLGKFINFDRKGVLILKIGVLTGGGDCPGLNPAIRGIVLRAIELGYEVIGIKDGWKELITPDTQPIGIKDVDEII